MNAEDLTYLDSSFDLVLADNVFEHVIDPFAVLKGCYRILRPVGVLLVPNFSSIYSKYGLHLKHGLRLPWANLLFSEAAIIRALQRLAIENPDLCAIYPGLVHNPKRVRDLRRYKDLNDITYGAFKEMAHDVGFIIDHFRANPTILGRIIQRLPLTSESVLMDICSTGAKAVLRKQL